MASVAVSTGWQNVMLATGYTHLPERQSRDRHPFRGGNCRYHRGGMRVRLVDNGAIAFIPALSYTLCAMNWFAARKTALYK